MSNIAGTIEVRTRKGSESVATHFTHWPAGDLDSLIKVLRNWGITTDDGITTDGSDVFGQFVIGDGSAYFEIVVGEEG